MDNPPTASVSAAGANANATTATMDASQSTINPTTTTTTHNGIPTLHHLNHSQSLRILWALEELAAAHAQPYELKTYKRQRGSAPPELKAIFPLGASPILVIDKQPRTNHHNNNHNTSSRSNSDDPAQNDNKANDDADDAREVVTESRLILQYLSDHYSHGLWTPTTAASRRRNDFWQEFATATLAQKVNFALLFDVVPPHVPWVIRPVVRAFCSALSGVFRGQMGPPLRLMEEALGDDGGRRWFAGERLGQADILMSWPMDMAVQWGYFDEGLYPKVAEWRRRIVGRPAYRRAVERGGGDGEYDLVTFGF